MNKRKKKEITIRDIADKIPHIVARALYYEATNKYVKMLYPDGYKSLMDMPVHMFKSTIYNINSIEIDILSKFEKK